MLLLTVLVAYEYFRNKRVRAALAPYLPGEGDDPAAAYYANQRHDTRLAPGCGIIPVVPRLFRPRTRIDE